MVFHGIAAAGCVMSPINSLYTPDEIAFQLKDSGAKILITISLFMDRAAAAVEKSPVDEIVVLDGAEGHANLLRPAGRRRPVGAGGHRPGERPGHAALLQRHDRPAQGRDAHPPQPGGQRGADAGR